MISVMISVTGGVTGGVTDLGYSDPLVWILILGWSGVSGARCPGLHGYCSGGGCELAVCCCGGGTWY